MTDRARELAHEIAGICSWQPLGICSWQSHGQDSAQIERVTGIIQAALRTARREARNEALEEAAGLCDKRAKRWRELQIENDPADTPCGLPLEEECEDCAAAIRKLIEESDG